MSRRLATAGLFVALLWVAGAARATPSGGISIGPAVVDVTLAPSEPKADVDIHLYNGTSATVALKVSIIDFGVLDETGGVAFLGAENNLERKYGLAHWAVLEKTALSLQPKESQQIKVSVINQESLAPGGHYGAVLFRVDNGKVARANDPRVNLVQELSSLILVKKQGGEIEELKLAEIDASHPHFGLPVAAKLRFQNSGNVHVTPTGTVRIFDPFSRQVASGQINAENSRILPESFRIFKCSIKTQKPAIWPGRYTMEVSYGFLGSNKRTIVRQSYLVANPQNALATLLLMLSAGGVAYRYRQKLKNPAERLVARVRGLIKR